MILVAVETILMGNYEFLSYKNMCIYKLGWCSISTLARVLNCISLERVGHQHSNMVYGICILCKSVKVDHYLNCPIFIINPAKINLVSKDNHLKAHYSDT